MGKRFGGAFVSSDEFVSRVPGFVMCSLHEGS
jgi:hypothetical protein